jgi:hypothetical protein
VILLIPVLLFFFLEKIDPSFTFEEMEFLQRLLLCHVVYVNPSFMRFKLQLLSTKQVPIFDGVDVDCL